MSELHFVHLGFGADAVEYTEAWQEQRRVHAARFADEIQDTCLLLEHPPVYTAGRRTADSERPLDGTPVVDVDRGGKITWHGPGQLVGYPILKLPAPGRRGRPRPPPGGGADPHRARSSAWRPPGSRAAAGSGCSATRWSSARPPRRPRPSDFDPRLAAGTTSSTRG